MTKVTIHLDKYLLEQLKHIAKQENITLNEVIVRALKLKIQELQNDGSL